MGATWLEKLRLLIWKNFLQQWRHKLQSVAEILLPVLMLSLISLIRMEVHPAKYDDRHWPQFPAYTLAYSWAVVSGLDRGNLSVAYSPESPVLSETITTAVAKLMVKNAYVLAPPNITLPEIPEDALVAWIIQSGLITLRAHAQSSDMEYLFMQNNATSTILAAVEFEDSLNGATELPEHIVYSLRFPARPRLNMLYRQGANSWRTNLVFPPIPTPGPRFPSSYEGGNDPGYVNEMFIALQHAISMELISAKATATNPLPDVMLQRLPHPEHLQDSITLVLQYIFPMMMMLSFTYTAVSTVRFVGREKESQLKEIMKIMGMPTALHWTAWFLKQFLFLLVSVAMMVILFKIKWSGDPTTGVTEYAILTHTPWTVLFFFISLYVASTIFFSFMLSGLFSKASTAALFTSVIWFVSFLPAMLLSENYSFWPKLFSCLSLNVAMSHGFEQITTFEAANRGMGWEDFFTPISADNTFLFGYVCLMLVFDCALYMVLALYIEKVLPGPFGSPLPWFFPLDPRYWCPRHGVDTVLDLDDNNTLVKEKDPTGLTKGAIIQNLTKVFNKNEVAVNNVNLNIYNDQITVLLGHNGAGKTTTISMLTGLLPPTHGTAILAGYDVTTHLNQARNSLGICPQHNVIFSDLTVREHLIFFSKLKGFKDKQMEADVDDIIYKLELDEKANTLASQLSGGQQRRLCVGIALCGSPRVMLLDEPTSGMDPSSRRALWDLLQREKKDRAMILTTHFMDEADILGDRIAIMSKGKLQCVGSPFFLKQHYGSGYKLVVVKHEHFSREGLTQLLTEHIPQVQFVRDRGAELYYSIPTEKLNKFEPMLRDLEQNMAAVGVRSYGLIPTTIEDVFMEAGAESVSCPDDESLSAENSRTPSHSMESRIDELGSGSASTDCIADTMEAETSVKGFHLLLNHILAMWLKRGLVTVRDWKMSLLQFCIPIIITSISIWVIKLTSLTVRSTPPKFLDLNGGYLNTETIISREDSASGSLDPLHESYKLLLAESNLRYVDIDYMNMSEYYLNRASDTVEMSRMRTQNVIAATFGDGSATAWFSNFGYHDVAVTLATMHNAILRTVAPAARIDVYNNPLAVTQDRETDMNLLNSILATQTANSVGTTMSIIASFFVIFYIKERVSRAKLLQKASGIQPAVMWGAVSVFDWLWFMVLNAGMMTVFATYQLTGLSTSSELGRSFLVLMVYCASILPLQYLCSFVITGAASGFVLSYFIHTFLGTMGSTIVEALHSASLDSGGIASSLDAVLQFFPTYTMVNAFRDITTVGLTQSVCMELCAVLPLAECAVRDVCDVGVSACCLSEDPYFSWTRPGISRHLVVMLGSMLFFWIVIMFIEYRLFNKIRRWRKCRPPPIDESNEDSDVVDEERTVLKVDEGSLGDYSLLTRGLTKSYKRNHYAVNQISFGVKPAECFGLLGVNGAGKTSTFKMLTGDTSVSAGDAFVHGHSARYHIKRVHRNIGYCPQFDALFAELTGRETLALFALLRGLRRRHARRITHDLALRLNFIQHIDKKVGHYSGGNKRKLSTAVALLGFAPLVYLDEPTTGVDPASKRQVWRAITHSTESGRSVVLTSHSMEECEALCGRLAIMVNGRFRCLGSPQHLKNKFSEGYYTLTAKLTKSSEIHQSKNEAITSYISTNFPGAKLVESYHGLVKYYLPDSIPWSRLFGVMEKVRDQLVEDYLISQTTLEQVFLQFTKYQTDPNVDVS